MTAPRLVANLGAEEDGAAGARADPHVRTAARLWSLLFASPDADAWPDALGPRPDAAAFPWLDGLREVAWLDDDPTTRRVHDKAFAWRTALEEGLVPACLRDLVHVLEPDDLRDPDAARRAVESRVADWPAWTRAAEGRFTLKPRRGCSGRGRVAGWAPGHGEPPGAAAFARLVERGGALLEPWLERLEDLSAQLWIDEGGGLHLLGTLALRVTPAGVTRGHAGSVDSRRRVGSGSAHDAALREAAAALGVAAVEAGARGAAGLDAFVFRGPDGEPVLRPVVEWNARFTLGTVALGLLRRALDARVALRPRPGVLAAFALELEAGTREAPGVRVLDLRAPGEGDRPGPALVYARDAAALAAAGVSSRTSPSSMR